MKENDIFFVVYLYIFFFSLFLSALKEIHFYLRWIPTIFNMASKGELKGERLFNQYFEPIYKSRWPTLLSALRAPTSKVAVWNRFAKMNPVDVCPALGLKPHPHQNKLATGDRVPVQIYVSMDETAALSEKGAIPPPPKDEDGILAYYIMDLASALSVVMMNIEPQHNVLDLCAAPGGKSVIICQHLTSMGGTLTCNEYDADRYARLNRTMNDFNPRVAGIKLEMVRQDGQKWHRPKAFQRVLVDAPCGSERHVVTQQHGLKDWDPKGPTKRGQLQRIILMRAFESLAVGGELLYATCSIAPAENDDVVTAALEKTRAHMELIPTKFPLEIGEATPAGGWMVLPDACDGIGPLYLCTVKRVADLRPLSDSSSSDDDDDDDDE